MKRTELLTRINTDGYAIVFSQIKTAITEAEAAIAAAQGAIESAESTLESERESLYYFAQIAKANNRIPTMVETRETAAYQVLDADGSQYRIEVSSYPYAVANIIAVTPTELTTITTGGESAGGVQDGKDK